MKYVVVIEKSDNGYSAYPPGYTRLHSCGRNVCGDREVNSRGRRLPPGNDGREWGAYPGAACHGN